jgi:hypothetical protein
MKRVLEITRLGLFKAFQPDATEWIRWGPSLTADEPHAPDRFGMRELLDILRSMARKNYDLIVLPAVHPDHRYDEPWHKLVAKSALQLSARSSSFPRVFSALFGATPHVILDIGDNRTFCETAVRLFPHNNLYFMRELDLDLIACPQAQERIRPLSLFVPNEALVPEPCDKTIDVFFGAAICNEKRSAAMHAACDLAERGLRVTIAQEPLPYRDFLATLARSWLVLSPEGYGWDCYRHYESCLAGSVPLINRPTYRRTLYLRDGVHCFYYDSEHGSLADLVVELLGNKDRLLHMGKAGRQHVLAHHTRSAIARFIMQETANQTGAPSGAA